MIATKPVRDILYAGPGEVVGELGDGLQHLVRCYRGVGNIEIYSKGEKSEQEVASHSR
jgi:hypothetical protein